MTELQTIRHFPCPALHGYVREYWFIADLSAAYKGPPIATTPHTSAVLSLNIGEPNATEFTVGAPRASLMGIQSRTRSYTPIGATYLVMAMLTMPGQVRLFPHAGSALGDNMVELGALIGDAGAQRLLAEISAAWTPDKITERLDEWLMRRLLSAPSWPDATRVTLAWQALTATRRVDLAAAAVDVSVRQLERWFATHVGHTPKALLSIERLQASVHAIRRDDADPVAGYSDQPHQIRSWQRHLGVTPSRYTRGAPSLMASAFNEGDLTHFL